MNKYEVYQVGKLPPLTTVEADSFVIDFDYNKLKFIKDNENIAFFNWNNIAGLKKVEGDAE